MDACDWLNEQSRLRARQLALVDSGRNVCEGAALVIVRGVAAVGGAAAAQAAREATSEVDADE